MKYQSRILICLFLANLILLPLLTSRGWAQAGGAADCPLPPMDVLGEDMVGFPRYPNSIRTRFVKRTQRSIMQLNQQAEGMEVAYRSDDSMNNILDFYNRQIKEQGWELLSSNYFGEHSIHIIISQRKKRILLMLRPHTSVGISARRSTGLRGESQPLSAPTIPANCYVIQLFLWDEADAKPLERRSNQGQLPRRRGR